ncbi:MAG: hypothetical protein U1F54_22145 [Burkholderiales bacterium]
MPDVGDPARVLLKATNLAREPLGPITPTISPGPTLNETPSTAFNRPILRFLTSLTSRNGVAFRPPRLRKASLQPAPSSAIEEREDSPGSHTIRITTATPKNTVPLVHELEHSTLDARSASGSRMMMTVPTTG